MVIKTDLSKPPFFPPSKGGKKHWSIGTRMRKKNRDRLLMQADSSKELKMIEYGFYKELDKTFEETIENAMEKITEHKFNIISQIDLKKKFKKELDIDYKQYIILGFCDPENAYKVVQSEENIGLLLPCKMIIYEKDDKTVIAVGKPSVMMASVDNLELEGVACDVEMRLKELFDSIK